MKKYFGLSVFITSAVVLSSCSVTSHVETAAGVDFSNYKTFGWVGNGENPKDSVDNEIVDNNIKSAVSLQLENKGWKETSQNPDVIVDYNVMVEKKVRHEVEPVYNYPYTNYYYNTWHRRMGYMYYPNNLMGYHRYNIPFKEGTLTVNMIDAKTNKLIWQGSAQGDVTSKSVTTQEMNTDVKSIFKKFDYPKTNS